MNESEHIMSRRQFLKHLGAESGRFAAKATFAGGGLSLVGHAVIRGLTALQKDETIPQEAYENYVYHQLYAAHALPHHDALVVQQLGSMVIRHDQPQETNTMTIQSFRGMQSGSVNGFTLQDKRFENFDEQSISATDAGAILEQFAYNPQEATTYGINFIQETRPLPASVLWDIVGFPTDSLPDRSASIYCRRSTLIWNSPAIPKRFDTGQIQQQPIPSMSISENFLCARDDFDYSDGRPMTLSSFLLNFETYIIRYSDSRHITSRDEPEMSGLLQDQSELDPSIVLQVRDVLDSAYGE